MKTIQLSGENLPISFGFGAIMAYENQTNKSVLDLFAAFEGNTAKFTDLVVLVACGLTNGARRAGIAKAYTAAEVADLLDETDSPMSAITAAMEYLAADFTPASSQKKTVKMPTAKKKAGGTGRR